MFVVEVANGDGSLPEDRACEYFQLVNRVFQVNKENLAFYNSCFEARIGSYDTVGSYATNLCEKA